MKRTLFLSAALLAAALVAVGLPGAAVAAPPANDDFANATTIDPSSLPFTDTVSVVEAGYEAGEIGYCGVSNTAWYSFTPTQDEVVRADPSGSSFYGAAMNAYRQDGSGLGGLSQLACSTYGGQLTFSVQAGYTYYLQAGSSYYGAGDLRLAFDVVPPPTNDDFANAKPIGSLPSSDSVDATAATVEAGEPTPACGYGQSPGTVWYAFIPSVTGSYMATSSAYYFSTQVAVYTGGGLGSLSQIGCRSNGQALTFHADAGTTYYLQTGGLFGGRGTINLNFFVAPNPVANFGFYPGDPSGFDTLQFYDQSYDPGGNSFTSETWDFGDGGTASSPGCCPTHKVPRGWRLQGQADGHDDRRPDCFDDPDDQGAHARRRDREAQRPAVGERRPDAFDHGRDLEQALRRDRPGPAFQEWTERLRVRRNPPAERSGAQWRTHD
jgi:hypothetical protein